MLENNNQFISSEMTEEEINKILKERAKILAKKNENDSEHSDLLEVVEFNIADETYAIEHKYIKEVYQVSEIVPIPNVPEYVIGIINLRGEIISVIDMKNFFGMPQKGVTNLNNVLVLANDNMKFGLLADEVLGTKKIAKTSFQESIATFDETQLKYFTGITASGIILLDAPKLLNDSSLVIDDKMRS